ncbi:uncharacterized protein VTP21DRAFT_3090 [Calcarisporiella thermophila]|uniref:uncharacterized protein n=1 Tax=Calcarisporiella thermophila TaxID=911321 RepID=UPI003743F2BA
MTKCSTEHAYVALRVELNSESRKGTTQGDQNIHIENPEGGWGLQLGSLKEGVPHKLISIFLFRLPILPSIADSYARSNRP